MDKATIGSVVSHLKQMQAGNDRFRVHVRVTCSSDRHAVSSAQGLMDIRLPAAFEVPLGWGLQPGVQSVSAIAAPLKPQSLLFGFMDCGKFQPRLIALAELDDDHAHRVRVARQQILQMLSRLSTTANRAA